MKYFLSIVAFVLFFGNPDLAEIRQDYTTASTSETGTKVLYDKLENFANSKDNILVAYKGAVMTLMAKHTKDRQQKKDFFKNGVALIEAFIQQNPNNIEAHYLRLSVQENAPKFLGYHKDIDLDKQFILTNWRSLKDQSLKGIVKEYVAASKSFTDVEKLTFK